MAGSTPSISSNEGHNSKNVFTDRGYNLTVPEPPSGAGESQSSRTQTPPPNLTQISNASVTNSPAASSRNALGITHGWGVGLAHSGSYLATNVRTTSTIPLLVEDPETYDAIRAILTQKKALEQSQLELRAKQLAAKKKQLPTPADQETITERRAKIELQVTQGKEQLKKLLFQRDEMEKNIRAEWDNKIEIFKNESSLKEEGTINELKVKHDIDMKQLMEDIEAQNKADEDNLAAKLSEMDEENEKRAIGVKREVAPAAGDKSEITVVPDLKRQKLNELASANDVTDSKELSDILNSSKSLEYKEDESDKLKEITDELNDLNKIKSQMVWLLKQVITAEAKLKMKEKRKDKTINDTALP